MAAPHNLAPMHHNIMNIIKCVTSKGEVLEVDVGLVEASRGRVHEDSPVRLLW